MSKVKEVKADSVPETMVNAVPEVKPEVKPEIKPEIPRKLLTIEESEQWLKDNQLPYINSIDAGKPVLLLELPTTLCDVPLSMLRGSREANPDFPFFVNDIKENGIRHNLLGRLVYVNGQVVYEVLDGFQRLTVAKKIGLPVVPVKIDASVTLEDSIGCNVQRFTTTNSEIMNAILLMIDEKRFTYAGAAKSLNISQDKVDKYLKVSQLPENIQELLRGNKISLQAALAFLKVKGTQILDEKQKENLYSQAKAGLIAKDIEHTIALEIDQIKAQKQRGVIKGKKLEYVHREVFSRDRFNEGYAKAKLAEEQAEVDGKQLTKEQKTILDFCLFCLTSTEEDIRKGRINWEEKHPVEVPVK